MDFKTLDKIEKKAFKKSHLDMARLGFSLVFLVIVLMYTQSIGAGVPNNLFLVLAAVFAGYMAMNIGANDVANNVGPAVGAKAMSMGMAIFIAVIFEASGALIAGGEVVSTIKNGIINLNDFEGNTESYIWVMMAALLAAALWLNLATYVGAPVSTTHSLVGAVMGAGVAAAGVSIVNWGNMGTIVSSWVISPLLGGVIAASFLFAIKKTIVFKEDKISASYRWIPIYVAVMAGAFSVYLILKGVTRIWPQILGGLNYLPFVNFEITARPMIGSVLIIGALITIAVYLWTKRSLAEKLPRLNNDRDSVNAQFTIPLIFAAALLSFAHGANDVSNAVGPLAAIHDAIMTGGISDEARIPFWVMAIGAIGIALGLALYGPKLIRTVGGEITDLDQIRAFSIAMAAAITVIVASQLGLPVSTTHIAIGGVFGVGFLREWLDEANQLERAIQREKAEIKDDKKELKHMRKELKRLERKSEKSFDDFQRIATLYQAMKEEMIAIKKVKKSLKEEKKNLYVKRDMVKKIITAWLITVPAAAVLSAILYFMIRGIML